MNYAKIQDILESEASFRDQVRNRTSKVATRGGGEAMFSPLAVQIGERCQLMKIESKAGNRAYVLAIARQLAGATNGASPVVRPPVPVVRPHVPAPSEEAVVVKSVPSPELEATPARQSQRRQTADLEQFVDRNDILKYQVAIAISQLLAAVYQLAQEDTWDGHESRKKLLEELLDEYESTSKQHVNFSVKQLIRAKDQS